MMRALRNRGRLGQGVRFRRGKRSLSSAGFPDRRRVFFAKNFVLLWHSKTPVNRPFALRGHVTSFLWKWKLYDFAFQKTISGSHLKQTNSDLVFQTRTISLKWLSSKLVTWPKCDFKIMNYLFLNTNFVLKVQGKCWKDDVVTFTAHLRVTISWTIKRLTS